MNDREEYRSIHQSNLRFLKDAKNLPYIINKKVIPYQIANMQSFEVNDSSLKRIQNLFQKTFMEYDVKVSFLGGLAFSSPSVLFQIILKNGTMVYESIAISFSEGEDNGDVSWPLLLILKLTKKDTLIKIHQFIQRTLKCSLKPIQLTEPQILWLIGISINETLKRNLNCGFSITCKLPTQTAAEIDLSFGEEILLALWDSIHDSMSEVIYFDELKVFFAQITSHIYNVYGIDVSQLSIISFLLKGIRLQFREEFHINAAKPEIMYLLLSFIISDCLSGD